MLKVLFVILTDASSKYETLAGRVIQQLSVVSWRTRPLVSPFAQPITAANKMA